MTQMSFRQADSQEVDENDDISDMEDLGDSDYMDNNEEE